MPLVVAFLAGGLTGAFIASETEDLLLIGAGIYLLFLLGRK